MSVRLEYLAHDRRGCALFVDFVADWGIALITRDLRADSGRFLAADTREGVFLAEGLGIASGAMRRRNQLRWLIRTHRVLGIDHRSRNRSSYRMG